MAVTHQKFGFDTHFDDQGRILSGAPASRPRRTYSAAEVEAIRAEAFAQGQAAQRQADEGLTAQALAAVAASCEQALPSLDRIVTAYRLRCADLALAVGEAMASAALDRFPRAPLAAALEALSDEISGTGRVIVRVAGADDGAAAALRRAAAEAGLAERLVIRDDAGLAAAAFAIEWPDGRAEFDPEAALGRVRAALDGALSAEVDGAVDLLNGES